MKKCMYKCYKKNQTEYFLVYEAVALIGVRDSKKVKNHCSIRSYMEERRRHQMALGVEKAYKNEPEQISYPNQNHYLKKGIN